jgi:hypothetical protein
MNCAVCGKPGEPLKAVRLKFANGGFEGFEHALSPGVSCSPQCASLIFARQTVPGELDEKSIEAWRWRQRRAESLGLPFDEAKPPTFADREWLVLKAKLERIADDGVEAA